LRAASSAGEIAVSLFGYAGSAKHIRGAGVVRARVAVLRVDDHNDLSVSTPIIAKAPPLKKDSTQRSRDSFVADTALKLEQLQASVRLLTRDVGQLAGKVAELQEVASQENRAYLYQQNEKRSREGKLDEMVRSFRDLKARLDRMEARSGGDYHAYNSFEAVSRKFADIEKAQEATRRVGRGDTFRACLLAVAILAAAGIIGASLMLSGGSI
jgi:hypothetical protein